VALFVRVPVPGRVKTRLATDLGNEGACNLYRAMVTDILSNITSCGLPLFLFHDGKEDSELPKEWSKESFKVLAQQSGSIGERMAAAFEYCFAENIAQVILVGSDIPGLDSRIILEASAALESHDAAIAPAADGGYCLVAFKQQTFTSAVFRNIPWSTDQVLRVTLERCNEYKLAVMLLKTLQDIDTIDDLKAYCLAPPLKAVATNRYLETSIKIQFPCK
jgi:hypothetical protein